MGHAKVAREAGLTNRDLGATPVMVAETTTLNTILDATFATDSDVSLKQTIAAVTALSASLAARIAAVEI